MEVIFTERFLKEVEECSDYIAVDDIPTTINWAQDVFKHCRRLRNNPQLGRIVPEFRRPEIREIIHGNYRLIYEIKSDLINMLIIWHSRRELPEEPL